MNITLVAQSADDRTGIGRIVAALTKEYRVLGHDVHLVTQRCEVSIPPGKVSLVMGEGCRPFLSKIAFRVDESRARKGLSGDVVHAFGVGKSAKVVSAQSCHRAAVELQKKNPRSRIHRRNYGLYDWISVKDEERLLMSSEGPTIVAVSQLVRRQILDHYSVSPANVVVIPNGIAQQRFSDVEALRPTMRHMLDIDDSRFVLLFMGNEFDRKGVQTILEAMSLLPSLPLTLIVVGEDEPRPYKRLAWSLQLGDRVIFFGGTDNPERLFAAADAFIFPTIYEPFGMVIIEAMAAGVPVVTAVAAGAVEGLCSGVHGLYLEDPLSPSELAVRIRSLVEDEGLRRLISAMGQHAAAEFGWPRIARRFLNLYSGRPESDEKS